MSLVETSDLLSGEVEVVHAELSGLAQDVVVDVGDVAHALGLVPEVAKPPLEDVVGEVRPRRGRGGPSRTA